MNLVRLSFIVSCSGNQLTCCISQEILALEVRDHCRSSDVDIVDGSESREIVIWLMRRLESHLFYIPDHLTLVQLIILVVVISQHHHKLGFFLSALL